MSQESDVIVIGSGLGGLSSAVSLAQKGFKVKVFEKLHQPGGFIGTFERKGYLFEASTHQIGAGYENELYLKNELKALELDIPFIQLKDCFETIGFDENFKINRRYLIKSGWEGAYESLVSYFPKEEDDIKKALLLINNLYEDVIKLRQQKKENKKIDMRSFEYICAYKDKSFSQLIEFIRNEEIKFLLSQYCFYFMNCLPSKTPAVFMSNAMANLMLRKPLFIKGGTKVFIDKCIQSLEKFGGEILYISAVEKILVDGENAIGVQLANGEKHYAKNIVSNLNAFSTYNRLIDNRNSYDEELKESLLNYKESRSIFQVYVGLPLKLEDWGYNASTMFFSSDKYIDDMYNNCSYQELNNSFLVTNYTAMDDSFAVSGKTSLIISEYTDNYEFWASLDRETYKKEKERATEKLLSKFQKVTGISVDRAEVCVAATPRTMEYYSGNKNGAIFGAEMCNFVNYKPIKNLFLVGADATLAGSVISVFDSGLTAANAISNVL